MVKNIHISIFGRVRGVGFRWSAYEKFVELGLVGKAENGPEGTVEIVVNGEEAALQKFIEWAGVGPTGARVEKVETRDTDEPAAHFGMEAKNRRGDLKEKEE